MHAHFNILTWETRLALCATFALILLGSSLLLGFLTRRSEFWLLVKICTGIAAVCAVAMIVPNIAMNG